MFLDPYTDEAFSWQTEQVANISELGHIRRSVTHIWQPHTHIDKLTVSGLRLAGSAKQIAKQLVIFCSISAVTGSPPVWRRQCFLYTSGSKNVDRLSKYLSLSFLILIGRFQTCRKSMRVCLFILKVCTLLTVWLKLAVFLSTDSVSLYSHVFAVLF